MKYPLRPLLLSFFLFLTLALFAQQKKYFTYLQLSDLASSRQLLPPPPAFGSLAFQLDSLAYVQALRLRATPRGQLAIRDAALGDEGLAAAFDSIFGGRLLNGTLPETHRLLARIQSDTGYYATYTAKRYYRRPRPYVYFHASTPLPAEEASHRRSGSYPSSHAAIGWAAALLLAEIYPQWQTAILQRGLDYGQSRVITGYHWQSDITAGQIVGAAAVARLHACPLFLEQLNKAKHESQQVLLP